MPSDLTIIVSNAGAPLASSTLASPALQQQRAAQPPTPEQIAKASQISAAAAITNFKPKTDNPSIQTPKRVEPTYTPPKRRKKAADKNNGDSPETSGESQDGKSGVDVEA